MKEEQTQKTTHTQNVNWFVKAVLGQIEGCIIGSIVRERSSIYELHGSALSPDCYRSKLCWNCVHAFEENDECLESFVCKKHLELYEDYYTTMVRVRNIERYGDIEF